MNSTALCLELGSEHSWIARVNCLLQSLACCAIAHYLFGSWCFLCMIFRSMLQKPINFAAWNASHPSSHRMTANADCLPDWTPRHHALGQKLQRRAGLALKEYITAEMSRSPRLADLVLFVKQPCGTALCSRACQQPKRTVP